MTTSSEHDVERYAEAVRRSGEALLAIINDVLDFSKIEAGKLHVELVDLDVREAVAGATELEAERARSKGLELLARVHPRVPALLHGDPGRLRQVLVNLVSNAVKFTDDGGEVRVRARVVSEAADTVLVRFEVEDTGIGIDPEARSRLFQSFSQADGSTSRRYGGTGLGLAISKRLVELMGGEIGVDSTPGLGSTFWFTMPLARAEAPRPGDTPATLDLDGVRVLVVHRADDGRQALVDQVAAWRGAPDEVASAEAALERLVTAAEDGQAYRVIIIDQLLPEVDGRALARKVQADSRLAATRVVLLQSVQEQRPTGIQVAGAAATLVKPVQAGQLFEAISRVLQAEAAEPLRVASLGSGRSAAASGSPTTSRPILVVEDNPVNQQVACGWLYKLGYRADVAANGFEALEALERIPYAAVLMDCQMPEMDGYEATAELRRREGATTHTPVIAMTAHVMYGDRERCLEAGMDDYLPKPVRLEDLDAALRRWLPADGAHTALIEPVLLGRLQQLDRATSAGELSNRITMFLEDTPRLLRLMHYAAAHQDGAALLQVAHALRGAATHFGLNELVGLTQRLERLVRGGSIGRAAELVPEVEEAFARARQPLENLRGQPEWLSLEHNAARCISVADKSA